MQRLLEIKVAIIFFERNKRGCPLLDFLLNDELKVYPVGMSIRLLSSRSQTIICCGIELFIAGMLVCQYICGWRFVWAWHFTLDDMDKLIYLGRMSNRNTVHQFVNVCFSLEHITVALCQNWKKEIPLSVMPKLWESTMTRVFSPRVFDKLSPMANGLA